MKSSSTGKSFNSNTIVSLWILYSLCQDKAERGNCGLWSLWKNYSLTSARITTLWYWHSTSWAGKMGFLLPHLPNQWVHYCLVNRKSQRLWIERTYGKYMQTLPAPGMRALSWAHAGEFSPFRLYCLSHWPSEAILLTRTASSSDSRLNVTDRQKHYSILLLAPENLESSSRENLPPFSPTFTTLNQRKNKTVSQERRGMGIMVRRGAHPPKWVQFPQV